ncbi:hypothetical protein, partial [Acidiphilium iwatense]
MDQAWLGADSGHSGVAGAASSAFMPGCSMGAMVCGFSAFLMFRMTVPIMYQIGTDLVSHLSRKCAGSLALLWPKRWFLRLKQTDF